MSRNTCVRFHAARTVVLCLGFWVPAVSQGQEFTVRGELKSAATMSFAEFSVQLVDPSHRNTSSRAEVHGDGGFEIQHVAPGQYVAVVTGLRGEVVMEQAVQASSHDFLEMRLPFAPPRAPGAATVSVNQLLHPPTKKAFRALAEARKLSQTGEYAKAAEALERAVRESPDFPEAHINLGVQYIRIGRLEAAGAEFQRAAEIAGPSAVSLCNLAWVQMRLGHRDQAIETARAGLRLDQSSPQGHLILGNLLAGDPRTLPEAITHLEKAAATMPAAQQLLTQLRK